jgi:thiamine pyrophosphokinase
VLFLQLLHECIFTWSSEAQLQYSTSQSITYARNNNSYITAVMQTPQLCFDVVEHVLVLQTNQLKYNMSITEYN